MKTRRSRKIAMRRLSVLLTEVRRLAREVSMCRKELQALVRRQAESERAERARETVVMTAVCATTETQDQIEALRDLIIRADLK